MDPVIVSGAGRLVRLGLLLPHEEGEEEAGLAFCLAELDSTEFMVWERGLQDVDIC